MRSVHRAEPTPPKYKAEEANSTYYS